MVVQSLLVLVALTFVVVVVAVLVAGLRRACEAARAWTDLLPRWEVAGREAWDWAAIRCSSTHRLRRVSSACDA